MKQILEDIWKDSKCRAPLSRVRWLSKETSGSTQEAPGLYYAEGGRNPIKRNAAHGQDSK